MTTTTYLWIACGGALGSVLRVGVVQWVGAAAGGAFPWGTVLVNVVGSFAIGFFAALTAPDGRWPVGGAGRGFFMAGVLGGFTTFSAFSLQTLELMRDGGWPRAAGNVGITVACCLVAVWLGHLAAVALRARSGAM